MSSEQVLVLLLLAAAFAAGWIARGRPEFDRSGRSDPAPPPPGPAGVAPPATATGDALIADADAVLARALTAARAAQAMAAGPAGTSAAAVSAAVGVLEVRLTELEEMADRLEGARGPDDPAFLAFDRAVSTLDGMRRRADSPLALADAVTAQSDWNRLKSA